MGDDKPVESMTVRDLKKALRSHKMSAKGTKEELVERLKSALERETDESGMSDSGSEGKTPRSNSPSTKLAEKTLESEEQNLRPLVELNDAEPPMLQRSKTTDTEDTAKGEPSEKGTTITTPVAPSSSVVPEWRNLHIPDDWLPMPLIRVSNIPQDVDVDSIRSLLEKTGGVKLAYVVLDPTKPTPRTNAALVRLRVPKEELFAEVASLEGECDVRSIAETMTKNLRSMELTMAQHKLEFEAPLCRTTLFVHNLEEDYGNKDDRFYAEMEKIGQLVRCFIVRNKLGVSKDYGFVEYLLPSDAMTAKDILDKKSAEALSTFKKQRNNSSTGAAMVPLKRLRCEWAYNPNTSSLYSKICYISNLPPNFDDREVLRNVFAPYGTVLSCNIRTRPGMGPGCGFVDFERGEDAEKALRTLDGSRDTPLGFILVSFVNPGKFPGDVPPLQSVGPFQRPVYNKRREPLPGNGGHPGAYGHHHRNPFFQPGRPPFEVSQRGGRFPRIPRGRNFRGGFQPYGNYNQGMYTPYYGSYGQAFVQSGYAGNGGYSQFPPQAPSYHPGPYGGTGGYGAYRGGAPAGPGVKPGGYGEGDYPMHDTYSGMAYSGGSSYSAAAGGTHPPSGSGSYGQGMNQTGYPSSYGTGYQAGYGQGTTTGYSQQGGGTFGQQQGSYSNAGYGGNGNVHGGQLPGAKREHEYDATSYGSSPYGKKPRF